MTDNDFTTIHIVTKESWSDEGTSNGLIATGDDGLTLTSEVVYGLNRRLGLMGRVLPVALAANGCGVLWLLAEDNLYRFDPNNGLLERISCLGGTGSGVGRLGGPAGIALGRRNLYVADTGNHRVYALALANLQIRWVIGAVNADDAPSSGDGTKEFDGPTDILVDPCDHLYVLDAGNRRIQKFDKHGRSFPDVPPFGAARLVAPTALTQSVKDGAILIHCLDPGLGEIVTFDSGGDEVASVGLSSLTFTPAGLAVDPEGKFYVSDTARFIHTLRPDGTATPLEEYEGVALRLVAGPRKEMYAIEAKGELALLTMRRRYPPAWTGSGEATGVYTSRVLDTRSDRILWHRATLDASIPAKTQIRLSWHIYGPGSDPTILPADSDWNAFLPNPADVLFERTIGRYLRFRLELISEDRHATPRVRGIHLTFPRKSYLRYLPAVFSEDEESEKFLERFLSLFESVFLDLEGEIFSTERYSDPWATPEAFLPWLGSWLALAWEEDWPEPAIRQLIASAHELYRKRGTRQGIIDFIGLYTAREPWIVEPFQLDCIRGRQGWAEVLRLYGDDPYRFTVLLPPDSRGRVETVRRMVDEERPAHTCAKVAMLKEQFTLGVHTYLEVNTALSEPVFTLETASSISRETYLADLEESGQMETRTRLGIDTNLT